MAIPGNLLSPTTESIDPNTSGWTSKLNCTIGKGTGGRNGDGCLAVKSVAAGEMQARTVSSYSVTAGTTYQVFADTAGVVGERIGIRWLAHGGLEVGITWSLTTSAASSAWHRVGVAGVAPPIAVQAQVILSSTEVGSLVSHYWENVYLGLPITTQGNLLPFNTESSEVDASGWASVVNASVTRQVPVINWAVDNYLAGGHTLAMTAVASGNASILAVDRPTVTPGEEYLAYAYLQPPTIASTCWIELRFYDSNGNQVGAQRSTLAPPTPATGMYRQRASMVAPANAATCSVAAGLDSASAGQVLRLETAVVIVAPKLQAGSLLTYADSSFEQGVGGWTTASGVATLARTTPWGESWYSGAYALAATSATATASTMRSGTVGGIIEGENFRAQALIHPAAGSWPTVGVRVHWYDAVGADLGTSTATTYAIPGSSWYALPSDAIAPAGATQAAVELIATAGATSSVLHVDQVVLWQVLPQTAVSADSAAGYVTLTLRELPLDYLVSVHRVAEDGSRTLVRGPDGLIDQQLIDSDLLVIEDHEAPMGVQVYYTISIYAPSGALASSRTSSVVSLTLADINQAWLKDPGNPQRNLKVMVQRAPDWTRPIDQSTFVVRGRRNKVTFSGKRQGLEGDLAIWTRSNTERKALHLLLDSGNTLLWQAAPDLGVDDMYVTVGQVPEARVGALAQEQIRTWTLPLTEADMPVTTGVNGSGGRTWQDVLTEFETWQRVLDTFATWEDVLLNRRRE
ncbi:hypothetical protein [Streptomyces resistomycificus]|uniref:CBM-cenC domain-containing protein n=1 Tax=Streptomyces resistomycificus TaxID=67356 RepID=A0A0L8L4X9_9ACTN|nr:hypothetical protein [Streptomyces resistomycificus]KOG33283.1 hypothetical protein ADK37_23120 [Streptomyces resistomycificus]KUN99481.1 hypothetical protein AQJ84_11070 [Streptomyces resistomycificus]